MTPTSPSIAPASRGPVPVESAPWWRVGMVWLVLSFPAVAVVAGTTTAVIAYRGADPVVKTPRATSLSADAPARDGRNHVNSPATGTGTPR
jgi:uncharacterized protein